MQYQALIRLPFNMAQGCLGGDSAAAELPKEKARERRVTQYDGNQYTVRGGCRLALALDCEKRDTLQDC